ncbi:hypothetical protein EON63_00930 [archaeon]|nr:MAG: hypothetical protein EON63_00930 [archaeon]
MFGDGFVTLGYIYIPQHTYTLHTFSSTIRYNSRAIPEFLSRLYLDYPDSDVPRIVDRLLKRCVCASMVVYGCSCVDVYAYAFTFYFEKVRV